MRLIIEDDAGRRTVVPFAQDEISIGREEGNTVRLPERNVSRRHAVLSRRDDCVSIEDLGSQNGVRINGDRIRGKLEVGEGDIIQIGDYDLTVEDESKPALPERPTQPELGVKPADSTEDVHAQLEALARMQRAAAIQAALSKGKPTSERDTDPKRAAAPVDTPWPPEFHRLGPEDVAAAVTAARRRRLLRVALSAVVAVVAVVLILRARRPPVAPAPALAGPVTPVVTPPPEQAPPPEPAVPSPVAAAAPPVLVKPGSASPRVAIAPAPVSTAVTQAAAARASRAAARQKAHDLYQDAVADVGNGDYPAALTKLQEALRLDPSSPEAHKEAAICYSHLKQADRGAYHYEQYLKLAPEAPDAEDVRKMLSDYEAAKGK